MFSLLYVQLSSLYIHLILACLHDGCPWLNYITLAIFSRLYSVVQCILFQYVCMSMAILYNIRVLYILFQYACMSMAILLHYFLLTMFSWMLVEGFHLYIMLVQVFKTNRNFRKYLAFGWGMYRQMYSLTMRWAVYNDVIVLIISDDCKVCILFRFAFGDCGNIGRDFSRWIWHQNSVSS